MIKSPHSRRIISLRLAYLPLKFTPASGLRFMVLRSPPQVLNSATQYDAKERQANHQASQAVLHSLRLGMIRNGCESFQPLVDARNGVNPNRLTKGLDLVSAKGVAIGPQTWVG